MSKKGVSLKPTEGIDFIEIVKICIAKNLGDVVFAC